VCSAAIGLTRPFDCSTAGSDRVASHPGGQACVCEISSSFDVSQPTISHHLKMLRSAGLLDCERRGTWVYYWVIPSALHQLS